MAFALVPPETRVHQILKAAPAPMSAEEILHMLKTSYGMKNAQMSSVRSALHNSPAYSAVIETQPPKWFVQGSPAATGAAEMTAAALAKKAGAAPASVPAPAETTPATQSKTGLAPVRLGGIPPPEVVPAGEFAGGTVVVGGESDDLDHVAEVITVLVRKGARHLVCLGSHTAGRLAAAAAKKSGIASDTVEYTGADPRRAVATCHAEVLTNAPVALCIIGPLESRAYEVCHAVAEFEARKLPVYLELCS